MDRHLFSSVFTFGELVENSHPVTQPIEQDRRAQARDTATGNGDGKGFGHGVRVAKFVVDGKRPTLRNSLTVLNDPP